MSVFLTWAILTDRNDDSPSAEKTPKDLKCILAISLAASMRSMSSMGTTLYMLLSSW